MKSPFPGVDPYLERNWRDVHATLIVYMKDQLQPQLGGPLRARVEERLVVEKALDEVRDIYPDVRAFESLPSWRKGVASSVAVLDLQPLVVAAYANGAYDDLDYSGDCIPSLEGEDAAWVDRLLREAGKR